jgi:hypothetical protein
MVCSTREIVTTSIQPNILRTCKELYEQSRSALYHENLFVFSSQLHELDAFDSLLGWLKNDKIELTAAETSTALDTIFDQNAQIGLSRLGELFVEFLRYIGRENAKLLDKIQIDGVFLPSNTHSSRKRLDFSDTLPIHATRIGEQHVDGNRLYMTGGAKTFP